jgi:hypothetical protein
MKKMNNKKLMKKIIELDTQTLMSRQQSLRVMVQIATIRKAFGVKNNESNLPIKDFEREIVLSDNDITNEFNQYVNFLKWAKVKNDLDKVLEFENQLNYFIDAVRFFNGKLADDFQESLITL